MTEFSENDSRIVDKANFILNGVDLSWKDLENKTVLDGGAGEAKLAHGASLVGSTAKIFSVDVEQGDNWMMLPGEVKNLSTQADVEELPFSNDYFDIIINHGSIGPLSIEDELRVLKPGGEIRLTPIGGQILDMWWVGIYLESIKGFTHEQAYEKLQKFEKSIEENDGWRPNEYAELQKASIETLTQEQKIFVIDSLVKQYIQVIGYPLSYVIRDPEADEPNGYIIYKKPS